MSKNSKEPGRFVMFILLGLCLIAIGIGKIESWLFPTEVQKATKRPLRRA